MALKRYEKKEPLRVSAEMVFAAVKSVIDLGEEQEFLKQCRRAKASVIVEADHINFVKEFLHARPTHTAMATATRVVSSQRCRPA